MNEIINDMCETLYTLPFVDRPVGCGGWKQVNTKLSVVLDDGTCVEDIECWRHRDDVMLVKNGRKFESQFTSYRFEVE